MQQTNKHTYKQSNADRQINKKNADTQTNKCWHKQINKQTLTSKQATTDKQINTDKQKNADKRTNRQTN